MTIKIDEQDLYSKRQTLIDTAQRAFDKGLQTNAGGNLSVRLAGIDACVIKPSGVGYPECTHDNLMVVGFDGTILLGTLKPSKDKDFHLAIYRARPDVNSVVHVHSPWATGWASAKRDIPLLTVQSIEKLGHLPSIPLGENGGLQSASQVQDVFKDKSIRGALMHNHGTIGVGATMLKALQLCEIIEETAHIATVKEIVSRS